MENVTTGEWEHPRSIDVAVVIEREESSVLRDKGVLLPYFLHQAITVIRRD